MAKVVLLLAFLTLVFSANLLSDADLSKEQDLKENILSPALETKVSDRSERRFCEITTKVSLSQSIINFFRRFYLSLQPKPCKNRIEIKVIMQGQNVILQGSIQLSRIEVNYQFTSKHPGTYQISSFVDDEPFELSLVARSTAQLRKLTNNVASYGIKFFFMKKKPLYVVRAEFALLVNGEERLRHVIGSSRSERQYRGARIRIDPSHLVDMKILEDF